MTNTYLSRLWKVPLELKEARECSDISKIQVWVPGQQAESQDAGKGAYNCIRIVHTYFAG